MRPVLAAALLALACTPALAVTGDIAPGTLDEGTVPPTWVVEGDDEVNVGDVIVLMRAAVDLQQLFGLEEQALPELEQRVAELETQNADLQLRVSALESMLTAMDARLEAVEATAEANAGAVASLDARTATNEEGLAELQDRLVHVRREGNELWIEGANLRVANGLAETATENGLGNLVIGYDESRNGGDLRTASHSLVIGPEHDRTGWGVLVAGRRNAALGAHATAAGGSGNVASGVESAVLGGQGNEAGGDQSAVSGGFGGEASGRHSVTVGGQNGSAEGDTSVVVGGRSNAATGTSAAVLGGDGNRAEGNRSAVAGGTGNTAAALYSAVSGGTGNSAGGTAATVGGGQGRSAPDSNNWAAGSLLESF